MKVVVLVVALLVVYCSAQSGLTATDISTILTLHNNARGSATPTPATPLKALVWDTTLASEAQAWAAQCKQNYSPKFYGTVYGENLLIMTPSLNINSAFNYWFKQKDYYNHDTASCSTGSCEAYKQIVSSSSTAIGCGVATCSFGSFFVCDYKAFAQYSGVRPYTPAAGAVTPSPTSAPTPSTSASTGATTSTTGYATIDYRGTKAVVGVHDQKQCGSCWAFSTTAIIEGALGMKGQTVPMLSDQNVLDCSGGGSCDGGWTVTALKGMITKGGINTNAAYPYTQTKATTCAYNAATSQGKILKTGQTSGTFAAMYSALAQYGPVGIAVFVDNSWYSYKSGVLAADYTSVNHAVTVVGYDQSLDAWIVKNSWGSSWGMSGYLYISASRPAGAQQNGAFWAQA